MTNGPKALIADKLHSALLAAGIVQPGELIRRIVIDAKHGEIVVIHIERIGDTRLLDVVQTLAGIEIRESQQTAHCCYHGAAPCPPRTDHPQWSRALVPAPRPRMLSRSSTRLRLQTATRFFLTGTPGHPPSCSFSLSGRSENVKRCSQCGMEKPLEEFAPRKGRPGARRSRCHECDSHYSAAYYAANHPEATPRGQRGTAPISYAAAHLKVRRERGRAAGQRCANGCGRQAEHWAYDHEDPDEVTGWHNGRRRALLAYSLNPAHYVALCRPCHGLFDSEAAARRAADRVRATTDDLATWVRPSAGFALIPETA